MRDYLPELANKKGFSSFIPEFSLVTGFARYSMAGMTSLGIITGTRVPFCNSKMFKFKRHDRNNFKTKVITSSTSVTVKRKDLLKYIPK